MEIIIAVIVLIIVWCVAFMVGNKQGATRTINQIKKDGDLYNEGINEGFYLGVEYMQQQILNQNK
jgi:L-asparagine transporter-like permease